MTTLKERINQEVDGDGKQNPAFISKSSIRPVGKNESIRCKERRAGLAKDRKMDKFKKRDNVRIVSRTLKYRQGRG